MKKSKIRILVCLMAAVSCTAAFSVNALAASTGTNSPALGSSSAAQSSTMSSTSSSAASSGTVLKPLTPDGTGTVIDNVTNEDGKEFFTVTTPSKHVFYLIIDRQKDAENVYFLDAVTDKDLLALAKSDGEDVSGSSPSKTGNIPRADRIHAHGFICFPARKAEQQRRNCSGCRACSGSRRRGGVVLQIPQAG